MEKRLDIKHYISFKQGLIENKMDFTAIETTFTKRIKLGKVLYFFTDDDKKCVNELKLINYVKKDANKYLGDNPQKEINEKDITFYSYFGDKSEKTKAYKIDLTSAYWQRAKNLGLISKDTQVFFDSTEFYSHSNPEKASKKARLKALGSLATKKFIYEYKGGLKVNETPEIVVNEILRGLYLHICNDVDLVMKALAFEFRQWCVYYYWDCLFFRVGAPLDKIQEFIRGFGFESTCKETFLNINHCENYPFVEDMKNRIKYNVRKEEVI